MFGLGTLFYSILFLVNGIAVLSEDRFLNRIGWGSVKQTQSSQQASGAFGDYANLMNTGNTADGSLTGVKSRLINLISATRTLLRFPLIVVNVVVILYDLILG
ncbi:DEKNAAC102661 [Brettanomyces naardenensis]|uniref:DEKNAAC102661 n=1 Tax=Brettanomyces naardenensis TaxID=13370 RepID=A0A448YKR4_BRENA|nr:DEKNAAC102661 [Brettanomyces naardenensis]